MQNPMGHGMGKKLFKQTKIKDMKYICDIGAINENTWSNNSMEYDTIEECKEWLDGLKNRWFGYNLARIVPLDTNKGELIDLTDKTIYQNYRESVNEKFDAIFNKNQK